jgi:hypothetical protein
LVKKQALWDEANYPQKRYLVLQTCVELVQLGYLEADEFGYSVTPLPDTATAKPKRHKTNSPLMKPYEEIHQNLFDFSSSPSSSSSLSSSSPDTTRRERGRALLLPVSPTFTVEKLSNAPVSHTKCAAEH